MKIDIDRNIAATDTFIETRVYKVYEDLKKKDRITEKYSRTWFDPFEKEFYDDITFKSRSTPLTLTGLYQVPGNTRGMQPILIFSLRAKYEYKVTGVIADPVNAADKSENIACLVYKTVLNSYTAH